MNLSCDKKKNKSTKTCKFTYINITLCNFSSDSIEREKGYIALKIKYCIQSACNDANKDACMNKEI